MQNGIKRYSYQSLFYIITKSTRKFREESMSLSEDIYEFERVYWYTDILVYTDRYEYISKIIQ